MRMPYGCKLTYLQLLSPNDLTLRIEYFNALTHFAANIALSRSYDIIC
jgi:hypothetical protein